MVKKKPGLGILDMPKSLRAQILSALTFLGSYLDFSTGSKVD